MTMPARALQPRQSGVTYLAVLLLVALMGAMLAAAGVLWHTAQVREKERELLFIGNEYRRAIQLYYNSPGGVRQFPSELAHLVRDPRQSAVKRYLRKLYRDPMTGKPEWGLEKNPDGSIAGVYSLSNEAPFKTANFSKGDTDFEGKAKYSDWKFVYRDTPAASSQPQQKPAAGQGPQQSPSSPNVTPPASAVGPPTSQSPQGAAKP